MAQPLESVAGIPPCQQSGGQVRQQHPQINPLFSPSFAPSQDPGSKKTNSLMPFISSDTAEALTPLRAEASSITMP
jgi:hypothetical protein